MICARCEQHLDLSDPSDTPPAQCAACGQDPLLDGRWRLSEMLGRGAVGTTWAATRASDGRAAAIKEIPLRGRVGWPGDPRVGWPGDPRVGWPGDPRVAGKERELIEREVRVLRELDHPGVPAYIEHFTAGEAKARALYLVQERVEGQTLAAEAESRRYTEAEALEIVRALLEILADLHALSPPVIHRDIKPANVMRRPDGGLVLIDFGSVRDALKGDLGGSTVAGTFGYMAPEQFAGDASPASDLYAVGALLVATLTREDPQRLMDRLGKLRWRDRLTPSPRVDALLTALLAPDPDDRPESAAAALEILSAPESALTRGGLGSPEAPAEIARPAGSRAVPVAIGWTIFALLASALVGGLTSEQAGIYAALAFAPTVGVAWGVAEGLRRDLPVWKTAPMGALGAMFAIGVLSLFFGMLWPLL